jgi:hypothetical protein
MIIRADGRKQEAFIPEDGWVKSNLLLSYLYDEGEYYDMYEEIGESAAVSDVEKQKNNILHVETEAFKNYMKKTKERNKTNDDDIPDNQFNNTENIDEYSPYLMLV